MPTKRVIRAALFEAETKTEEKPTIEGRTASDALTLEWIQEKIPVPIDMPQCGINTNPSLSRAGVLMQATTAKQVHELFVERFNALDADGIMALYEPNAVILPPDAPEAVSGHVAIREVLDGLLALKGKMENTIVRVIERQDIAILYSRWTLSGTDADGTPVSVGGTTSDVVCRQSDGRWLFAIDNPLGGAA